MRNGFLLTGIITLVFAGSLLGRRLVGDPAAEPVGPPADCRRIVSMAPSVTETLFALGLGERVVGVSRFCDYPPEARTRPHVGGLVDPNFEAILALRPDLIIMLVESAESEAAFRKLGLPTLTVCHQDLDGIRASFLAMGHACGGQTEARARQMTAEIDARIARVRRKTAGRPRPRVMLVAGRTLGSGRLEDVYIAANDGHLDKLIAIAGGQNAYPQGTVHFPTISAEGILKINPQVIIELPLEDDLARVGEAAILADWQQVAEVEAVRQGRVYIVADDRAARPGPSFVVLLERLARLIHPEVKWDR